MFKVFKEQKIERFKEFDEARKYIEKFGDESFLAIDYMIDHKEYYFLLKNLLKQKPSTKIAEYIFYSLPCLKRKEDLEILLKLFYEYDVVKDYVKACKNMEFLKMLYMVDKQSARNILKEIFFEDDLVKDIERSFNG